LWKFISSPHVWFNCAFVFCRLVHVLSEHLLLWTSIKVLESTGMLYAQMLTVNTVFVVCTLYYSLLIRLIRHDNPEITKVTLRYLCLFA
jgi:hypothetical protein